MSKTKEKLEPRYKSLCLKLGELNFQSLSIESQKEGIIAELKAIESLYKTFEELESELTAKSE